MNTHTPGPWLLGITSEPGTYREVLGSGGRIGATCQSGRFARVDHIPEGWGDAEANARLIAAAPELLKCLEDFVKFVSPGDDVPLAAMLDDARAVIAKAKGEEVPADTAENVRRITAEAIENVVATFAEMHRWGR